MIKTLRVPKNIAIAVYLTILIGTVGMAGLLCMQYLSFMQEAQELIQVKESYYQYVEMLKRSLNASLSDNNSDAEDEPDDSDSKKKNEPVEGQLQASLFITSIDEDKNADHEFDLISPEEDNRLHSIKKTVQKINPRLSSSKKKGLKRIKKLSAHKNASRYTPQRDFDFAWPVELPKFWLSSLYGPRRFSNGKLSFHHGIDMASMRGTYVRASAAGRVQCAQWVSGYGNCIDIYHNEHYKTRYAHLDSIGVRAGQVVEVGQFIGTVGDTGFVRKSGKDASHLHFEIHYDGQSVNPLKFLFT
jgi:murein DD-endopeptidase MepM/ murein hydrolase activator NlpD